MAFRPRSICAQASSLLLGFAVASSPAMAADPMAGDSDRLREARAQATELGRKLKAQLEGAMKAGGPEAALSVCNTVAPGIAAEQSQTFRGRVGRTALKVRNTANAPSPSEAKVLERFVRDVSNGADASALEHSEIVEENGRRQFLYMKAIPMLEMPCAACHGTQVRPELLGKIRDLYPNDKAIGFKPGEIRGAFSITKSLP